MAKITNADIMQNNRKNIFFTIYQAGQISKQQIAENLSLSMPTVTHNLKDLEGMDLIIKDGFFSSSVGRKAQIIRCNKTARIAVGVEVLKEKLHIVAVDLYGDILAQDEATLPFSCSQVYYFAIGNWINQFVAALPFPNESVLGVGIAIQGLVSPDFQTVTYGEILGATGLTLKDFAAYVKYPCSFFHDTEAAAFTQIWNQSVQRDTLYILINKTLGGSLIINGKTHRGENQISGTVEHMCLHPEGRECYCGKKGCVEAYCSLNALTEHAGVEAPDIFFSQLREGSSKAASIWKTYLTDLAMTINNATHVVDCDVVLSGQLCTFLCDDDISFLEQELENLSSFPFRKQKIRTIERRKDIAAVGAGIWQINDFFNTL